MPEEEKKQPQSATPETNANLTPADLAALKAELEDEKKLNAAAEAALAERDKRIAELQASISVVQQAGDTAMTELTQLKDAHAKAISKYLEAVKAANPTIPGNVITGATVDEIDASAAKALSIATAVKANLEAEARQVKVPAGAPPRGEIPLEALSPRDKIAAGIQQKGGTT